MPGMAIKDLGMNAEGLPLAGLPSGCYVTCRLDEKSEPRQTLRNETEAEGKKLIAGNSIAINELPSAQIRISRMRPATRNTQVTSVLALPDGYKSIDFNSRN